MGYRHYVVVDGRNLFEPEQMRAHGFEYYSLGREDVTADPGSDVSAGRAQMTGVHKAAASAGDRVRT